MFAQIQGNTKWQGELWRALVVDVKSDVNEATHRAALHNQFLALLADKKHRKITFTHIYFGIPALPTAYLNILQAISSEVDIHLFLIILAKNIGDISDLRLDYLRSRQRYQFNKQDENQPLFSRINFLN